jgi:squalene-hopene/tetraprenyl-beta-curcumene cyclase
VLEEIQPSSGGFLEATPLTSFVTMSLIGAGRGEHPVARRGIEFLVRSARHDGSWPIDTNLATWVTTLAVNALAADENVAARLTADERRRIRDWLLGQQYATEHPYTGAAPGGWAWTDLPGGVPDADDTAGALLALKNLGPPDESVRRAARAGVTWLLDLQNRDGGIPTFCRGWGRLPFDRSSPDITAHALEAWAAWEDEVEAQTKARIRRSSQRALRYLAVQQRPDGAWSPLWFGNQFAPSEENLTYGTARVASAVSRFEDAAAMTRRAIQWLLASQNADGGWGGAGGVESSIEETALAVAALSRYTEGVESALCRGVGWLVREKNRGPAPIGFYFAKLWYFEELYLLIFSVGALAGARQLPPGSA